MQAPRDAELDQSKIITFSLDTDDELEAFRRARRHDEMVEAVWREPAREDRPHSKIWDAYRAALGRVRFLGFDCWVVSLGPDATGAKIGKVDTASAVTRPQRQSHSESGHSHGLRAGRNRLRSVGGACTVIKN